MISNQIIKNGLQKDLNGLDIKLAVPCYRVALKKTPIINYLYNSFNQQH